MKNPFCLDPAVYKTVDGQDLEAYVQVPFASDAVPFGTKLPVVINIPTEAGLGRTYSMINEVHDGDLAERRYIRVSFDYRPTDQPDLLQGPVQDCRDLLAWIHDGGLATAIEKEWEDKYPVDLDRVYASGISYGGLLALSLGWDVPRPVAGILAVSPPCDFSHPQWAAATPRAREAVEANMASLNREHTPRGSLFDVAVDVPPEVLAPIDPVVHATSAFPPTFLVYSAGDTLVPVALGRALAARLRDLGVRCELVEVPGDEHLFASRVGQDSEAAKAMARGLDFLSAN